MGSPTDGGGLCKGRNNYDNSYETITLPTSTVLADVAVGEFIVVVSNDGSTPSDSQGNTYTGRISGGSLNVWDAECTTALTANVDTITVSGSKGFWAHLLRGVDPDNPIDGSVTASGSTSSSATFSTGTLTDTTPFHTLIYAVAESYDGEVNFVLIDNTQTSPDTEGTIAVPGGSCATRPNPNGFNIFGRYHAGLWAEVETAIASRDFDWSSASYGGTLSYAVAVISYRGRGGEGDARRVSFDRRRDTLTVLAHVRDDTSLRVTRYDDAGGSAGTVTVVASGATSCSLFVTRDGVVRVFFTADDAFKRVESRDGGSTWGSVTTIASGYDACTVARDETSGLIVAGLYVASSATWYVSVSSVADIGTWTTPVSIATSATVSGEMRRRRDGVWEFAYVNSSDAAVIIRSRNVSLTSGGSWS